MLKYTITNQGYILVKPFVEQLGLDYKAQLKRIKRNDRWDSVKTHYSPGGVALPPEEFLGFVKALRPTSVPEGYRKELMELSLETLTTEQSEEFGPLLEDIPAKGIKLTETPTTEQSGDKYALPRRTANSDPIEQMLSDQTYSGLFTDQKVTDVHGIQVISKKHQDNIYIPIRSITDSLGLDFRSQIERVNNDSVLTKNLTLIEIMTPTGVIKTAHCLPLSLIPGFIFGVQEKSVKESVKPSLALFKEECYKVLYETWYPRDAKKELRLAILDAQTQEELTLALRNYEQGIVEPLQKKYNKLAVKVVTQAPKADYHDRVLNDPELLLTTQVAETYGWTARQLNAFLKEHGVITQTPSGVWTVTAKYKDQFLAKPYTEMKDKAMTYLKWTHKGRRFVDELIRDSVCY